MVVLLLFSSHSSVNNPQCFAFSFLFFFWNVGLKLELQDRQHISSQVLHASLEAFGERKEIYIFLNTGACCVEGAVLVMQNHWRCCYSTAFSWKFPTVPVCIGSSSGIFFTLLWQAFQLLTDPRADYLNSASLCQLSAKCCSLSRYLITSTCVKAPQILHRHSDTISCLQKTKGLMSASSLDDLRHYLKSDCW